MIEILSRFSLGDMVAWYLTDPEDGCVELMLLPEETEPLPQETKRRRCDSLVQARFAGERQAGGYTGGRSMRCGGTVEALRLRRQYTKELPENALEIVTELSHPQGCFFHCLRWRRGDRSLRCRTEFVNEGAAPVTLELLSSFSLGGLTPLVPGAAPGALWLHRLESAWSMEGRLLSQSAEELNLEPSWARYGVRCCRFGQVGSMPVNGWFPWAVAEDRANQVFWGCMLCHNASWQIEFYRRDDGLSISGGLADYEFGHWRKTIAPGERFSSPEAILTTARGGTVDDAAQRMTDWAAAAPPWEAELPVICNEYCSSWGCPTEKSVADMAEAVKGHGMGYFVIDAGWYQTEPASWDTSMGDYEESRRLFPGGLKAAADTIRRAGMIPGIWFEPETAACHAKAFSCTDHMLKRDGVPVTAGTRRFWDMRDPWVRDRLRHRVIDLLKSGGFGYVKLDYNDTIGLGCDGAESPGEALRQNMAATLDFWREIQTEVPGIVVESCASGGHRLEPGSIAATAMSSFSDAHECAAIPIIAANLHRVMPPRQSQIWAVIRSEDSLQRIAYSVSAGFLGRLCLSGDLTALGKEQWRVIDRGLALYRRAAPVIRSGHTSRFGPAIACYDDPRGWQGVLRQGEKGDCLAVFHQFNGPLEEIAVPLPEGCGGALTDLFAACGETVRVENRILRWRPERTMSGIAVYMEGERS